jgi:hypothetical protein
MNVPVNGLAKLSIVTPRRTAELSIAGDVVHEVSDPKLAFLRFWPHPRVAAYCADRGWVLRAA